LAAALRDLGGSFLRYERRLNLEQRALPEIGPMT
jgi:hypothetical protein